MLSINYTRGKVYSQNSSLDIDKDGIITKGKAEQRVINTRERYKLTNIIIRQVLTVKRLLVFITVIFCILLIIFAFLKESRITYTDNKATDEANISLEDASPLSTWLGEYSFSEYAPPDQNMFYSLTIYREGNNFFGELSIDGFQTMDRLLATVFGDENTIEIKFLQYLPDNIYEPYEEGDVLFTLQKHESKLFTTWGKIKPLLFSNQKTGEYFQIDYSTPDQ